MSLEFLSKLNLGISRVPPLVYLAAYLIAVPSFGFLYDTVTPHEFYAPYARLEPGAISDRAHLSKTLEAALRRSFAARRGQQFVAGNWRIDPDSLRVDEIRSLDGTELSFRVRLSADGIGEMSGGKTMGWSLVATIPEGPTSALMNAHGLNTYRFPEVDFSRYATPFREENQQLYETVFGQASQGSGIRAPALALSWDEEVELRQYLRGVKGDASSISGHFTRMVYLSAQIITTLGLGGHCPVNLQSQNSCNM
jgi:hypothetical protein